MTMNLKKTAIAAGMFTALAAASMSANAMRETEAGEANLVPFVLWDAGPYVQDNIDFGVTPSEPATVPCGSPKGTGPCFYAGVNGLPGFGINTVVKITVPMSVGNDVIPNVYTAVHSSPTNGTPAVPGPEYPADPDLTNPKTAEIHWYFLNQKSEHVLNGSIPVTPDDVAVLDWGAYVRQNGMQGDLNMKAGYLVFVTHAASQGFDADFSFFTEAWVIAGIRAGANDNTGGVIGLIDAKIPVIPMNDGNDKVAPVGKPTVDNSVIEVAPGINGNIVASPLVGGIRTNWSDGNGTDIGIVDLTLGNRSIPIGNTVNIFQVPTLLVVWNDRNASQWSNVLVEVFDDNEDSCSGSISLPWQLNLVWVETDVTAGKIPGVPGFPVPDFIKTPSLADPSKPQGQDKIFCVPSYKETPITDPDGAIALYKLLQGGFIKMYLPEPIDTGVFVPESAMVAFSIPLQYNATLETDPVTADWVLTDLSLIPFETALGHSRGMFSSQ